MSKQLKSALLNTSAKTDVVRSGGKVSITGLKTFNVNDLIDIQHRIQVDEVPQLTTIGTSTPTIAASTKYTIKIGNVQNKGGEGNEMSLIPFSTTAPVTLSGVAATDRSRIYVALAGKINASNLPVTAVANVGGAGVSMTIVDDGPYYDERPGTPRGPNEVFLVDDLAIGGGFADATHRVTTTAAVLQFGTGQRLIDNAPVFNSGVDSNLNAGEINAPEGAVTLQDYDAWFIDYTTLVTTNTIPGLNAIGVTQESIYVDNGAGAASTNLTGYNAFRTEMERLSIGVLYGKDPNAMITFFDNPPTFAQKQLADTTVTTGLMTGAAGDENVISFNKDNATFEHHVLGTQTILIPKWDTSGLLLNQDLTANDGMEISASIEAVSPIEYVVGTDVCTFRCELTVTDITDLNPWVLGFRKKEAFRADYNDYDELAGFALDSAGDETGATKNIDIHSIINGAATQTDDTTVDWANAETRLFELQVALDGTVSFFIDQVDVSAVQTPAFVFDADEVIIPFCFVLNEAGDHGLVASKWFSVGGLIGK